MKPILVGESNPYGSDPHFALYPAPDGSSGHRLAVLILGMSRSRYLDSFGRVNLCDGKWSVREARVRVERLYAEARLSGFRFILLGSKVAGAFGFQFAPFEQSASGTCLMLPHPSGLCRLWNEPGAFERARRAVAEFVPEIDWS